MTQAAVTRVGARDRPPLRWRVRQTAHRLLGPAGRLLVGPRILPLLRYAPFLGARARAKVAPPHTPWREQPPVVPASLRRGRGIRRDPQVEAEAFRRGGLQDFRRVHGEALRFVYEHSWYYRLKAAPRLLRASRAVEEERSEPPRPASATTAPSPTELSASLRRRAEDVGLSRIGVAAWDPKYTFEPYHDEIVGDRIIVCVLEQDWEATQTIPSATASLAQLTTYATLMERALEVATHLRDLGYRAKVHPPEGKSLILHYAVAAGLGQLGLNGQVLTLTAGSRCRMLAINTDAPLPLDEPVDYGVESICDACQACVRRCPVGAIPNRRQLHRGVWKAKINSSRCFPVVAQTDGCAVCMKVCPAQRYGLGAVIEEYDRSGRILGRDTDELEGYDWPLDGRHYGPGHKPPVTADLVNPPGWVYDPSRRLPVVRVVEPEAPETEAEDLFF